VTPEVAAVVAAGGEGRRLGREEPKAFVEVRGLPMLAYTLSALRQVSRVTEIVIVLPRTQTAELGSQWSALFREYDVARTVPGGEHRWQSVRAGLDALRSDAEMVCIHDAARPLATPNLFERVISRAGEVGAAIAAEPVTDTVKRSRENMLIAETVDRAGLWRAQTPQAFRREVLLRAYRRETGFHPTDESQLLEALGEPVALVASPSANPKVTTPDDLVLVEQLLAGSRVADR
jgi:2-C-methyl-D-erythritol 4-phosphate cytidylyltransferase